MSGPIVRKYGFPNFEKIFGDRDLQHGVEDESAPKTEGAEAPQAQPTAETKKPSKPAGKGKKGSK